VPNDAYLVHAFISLSAAVNVENEGRFRSMSEASHVREIKQRMRKARANDMVCTPPHVSEQPLLQ
jgi:hypothetical protein